MVTAAVLTRNTDQETTLNTTQRGFNNAEKPVSSPPYLYLDQLCCFTLAAASHSSRQPNIHQ